MPRRHHRAATLGINLPAATRADSRLWHAVVMSRLGRKPLARRIELATLFQWIGQSIARGEAPLSVVGTAAHPWVSRACELLGAAAVEIALAHDPAANPRACDWTARTHAAHRIDVSDPSLPRDALAVMLADRVDVALVRPKGTIHRLLLQRLAEDASAAVRILVPVDSWGQTALTDSRRVVEELIAAGAVGYCCRWAAGPDNGNESGRTDAGDLAPRDDWATSGAARVDGQGDLSSAALTSLVQQPQRWLIHWTRSRQGAWPGQSDQQFRDWLLLTSPQAADLSPLATLRRIVAQRQLIGTNRTVPGQRAVVCFSALPLLDVIQRRVFRPHLGRWDAEPFGLAIDRSAAKRLGAQPVIYADPCEQSLVPADQSWRLQARGRTYDWTEEQEWRLPGTADLRPLGPEEAVVFVDRCEQIAPLQGSPWPVISVQSLRQLDR